MEEHTEKESSYSRYPTESSSSGESVGDAGSRDLPQGLERFECDSTVPAGFEWCTCDLTVEECCADICDLLMYEAVKQRGDEFVMAFTTDYLRWSCCPPGYLPGLHIGIWDCSSRQLIAFIAAIPIRVRVMEESSRMVQIRFPAVQSDFRDRIPPNIVRDEIIRRIRSENIRWVVQQKRTLGPAPTMFRVWQRPLNSTTLFELGVLKNVAMTLPEIAEFYKLPSSPDIQGYKAMNASHVGSLTSLLNAYLQKFNVVPEFDEDAVKHWFLPEADLLHSYVYKRSDGNITRFCSFLTLREFRADSVVKLAYSLYNFAIGKPLKKLMTDAITIARENRCDSFFACDIMGYGSFLAELRFSPISLHVQYDFDLDGIGDLNPDDIGLVLF